MENANVENRLILGVLIAAVAIILIGSMLVPVINEIGENATPKYENAGVFADEIGDDDVSIVYTTSSLTVDGVAISDYELAPIFASDTLWIDCVGSYCTILTVRSGSGQIFANATAFSATVDASEKTVTFSSITYGNNSASDVAIDAYSWAFVASNDGEYSGVRATSEATDYYVASTSQIYGGLFASGSLYTIKGTSVYADAVATSAATVAIDTAAVSNVDGVYSFAVASTPANSDVVLTYGSSSTASINLLILPAEVVGETGMLQPYQLMLVIPVILLVAIIAFFAYGYVNRD